jgi:hypothetical protein
MKTDLFSTGTVFVLLLALAIGALFALAFDAVHGVTERSALRADIEIHPLTAPAALVRIPYDDLYRFMTYETHRNLRFNGTMRTTFTSTELTIAGEVFQTMFEDQVYVDQFRRPQDEGRAKEVDALRGYLSVTIANTGGEVLRDVVLSVAGSRFARVVLSDKDPAEVQPSNGTGRITLASLPAGATAAIDVWLDHYPEDSGWAWTEGITLTHAEGTGDIVFHQLVSPMFERFDRNPLIALASVTALLLLAFAVIILYVVSLFTRSGRAPRNA